jgi:hypothetical protein
MPKPESDLGALPETGFEGLPLGPDLESPIRIMSRTGAIAERRSRRIRVPVLRPLSSCGSPCAAAMELLRNLRDRARHAV